MAKTSTVVSKELREKLTKIAVKQLETSSDYKKPRMEVIQKYLRFYNNQVPKKLRQLFNIPVPAFSGMIDTMLSDFDEPITLIFKPQDPSDYFKSKKVTAAWEIERNSTRAGAKWDEKVRWDKKNAVFSGRGIIRYDTQSDPQYSSNFRAVNYKYFHCQPLGGGHLENHLFAGEENVFRTKADLIKGVEEGIYDADAVATLVDKATDSQYEAQMSTALREKFAQFQALKLDPSAYNYTGETQYNLAEWGLTYEGVRYYLVFDPWTQTGIRCEVLKDVYSSGYWPWMSWATHEDDENFWSKSYADDVYPVADSIMTMANQELTNREKRNFGARAYDMEMFPDVSKLDSAQYRPDQLVPADTKGGTRRIAEGVYRFDTPELQGTINLINWLDGYSTKQIGVGDGTSQAHSNKPSVIFAQQQKMAKRLSYKSSPFSECYAEIGIRFVQGLKDHMPASMAVKMLGQNGIEWDEITRIDLNTKRDFDIEVVSGNAKSNEDKLKKDARVAAITQILGNEGLMKEVNPKVVVETILKDIGNYDDEQIKNIMDTSDYGNKESTAKASESIQILLTDKEPEIYYGANTKFMQIILDYAVDNRSSLGQEKFVKFNEYVAKHAQIAQENMMRNAKISTVAQKGQTPPPAPTAPTPAPGSSPIPSPGTGANNIMVA
jgi:hypothetical protein